MTTPNSSGSGRVPSDQTDVQQPSIEKTPEHALASRFPNVKVSDVAPKRNHVTSDLLHAGAALVFGILVILVAVYLHGLTTGVEDDAHSASQAFDWLVDLPSSLLQQLIVISIVVGVLIQLVLNREWLQSACSVGALLIGVSAAKALAYAAGKPLVPVNHIEGHVSANYVAHPDLEPPFVCLVASGGHSHIVRVEDYGVYTLLGQTMDDAAGEAFDKAARVLGLPYPGGPLLDKLSREGNPHALKLPHVQTPGRYDYSFSGLKTALINTVHKLRQNGQDVPAADIAASFQHAAVELLSDKAMLAAVETGAKTVALAGGVASNSGLRNTMNDKCQKAGLRLVMPPPILCTDNAAMIGSAAFYRLMRGEIAGLDLNACPSLRLV